MQTRTTEVADGIYQFSTAVPGFSFNQYLVTGDEPLLFHTGPRGMFPTVSAAAFRVVAPERLRWIGYGHFEADECGSINEWLAAAPNAQPVQGAVGVLVSLADFADREPLVLADGEVLDIGGRRLRWLDTPHVPHGWDAGLLLEEVTSTLLCGDLFTLAGDDHPATTADDIVTPAIEADSLMGYSVPFAGTAPTVRRLAELAPATLAAMHGPAFTGDCTAALDALADHYSARATAGSPADPASPGARSA